MEQELRVEGFVIHKDGDLILSISLGSQSVRVGQRVISNGRFGTPENTVGFVANLTQPYTQGWSSNIIGVLWEDHQVPMNMKFKDLKF